MHVSLLDNDLYKFSMGQAYMKLFPQDKVTYKFINRRNRDFPYGFGKRLQEVVNSFQDLKLTDDEEGMLRSVGIFEDPYIDFIKGYRYNPKEVEISQEGPKLDVRVVGPACRTVLWEVPLMAVISEIYFENRTDVTPVWQRNALDKVKAQALTDTGMPFVEFGTRRRFSFENQERVVGIMRGCPNFKGTSNIFLAMKYGIPVKGTVSHEWFQFHSAKYGYILANKIAMELWLRVFNGKLAVVLPDTFTSKVFLRSFDSHLVNAYDGIRQDSGYHADFINLFYGFYKSCGIDPMTKICMFSDGIDSIQTIKDIQNACFGKFVPSAGIGTWLTNDCGVPPLDMVIKMNSVFNGDKEIPVVKLSDTPGKNSGDPDEVLRCKKEFGIL